MTSYRALTQVLLGNQPPAEPGELIPESYTNQFGESEPVDFERLVEIGAAEKVAAKPTPKAPASHSEKSK